MSYVHDRITFSGIFDFLDKLTDLLVDRVGLELVFTTSPTKNPTLAAKNAGQIASGKAVVADTFCYSYTSLDSSLFCSYFLDDATTGNLGYHAYSPYLSYNAASYSSIDADGVLTTTHATNAFLLSIGKRWVNFPAVCAIFRSASGESGESYPVYFILYRHSATSPAAFTLEVMTSFGAPTNPFACLNSYWSNFTTNINYSRFELNTGPVEVFASLDLIYIRDRSNAYYGLAGRPSIHAYKPFANVTADALAGSSVDVYLDDTSPFAVGSYVVFVGDYRITGQTSYHSRARVVAVYSDRITVNTLTGTIHQGSFCTLWLNIFNRGNSSTENHPVIAGFYNRSSDLLYYLNSFFYVFDFSRSVYSFISVIDSSAMNRAYNVLAANKIYLSSVMMSFYSSDCLYRVPDTFGDYLVASGSTFNSGDTVTIDNLVYSTIGSISGNVVTDLNQSFAVDSLVGKMFVVYAGTGVGQSRRIISNTATTITLSSSFDTVPTGASYVIANRVYRSLVGTAFGSNLLIEERY